MKRLLVLFAIPMAVACGSEATSSSASGDPQPTASAGKIEGAWELTSGYGPKGDIPVVAEYPVTLEIDGRNISGTAACNYYGAEAKIDGTSFDEGQLTMTQIGCSGDVATAEERYLDALQKADTISRSGDNLQLSGPDTEMTFEFLPPPPTASLTDTTWHLESLIYGSGPNAVVASAQPAELILHSNGKLEGSTGCRDLHGEWIEGGPTINFTTFGAEGNCPPELRDQDGQVVGVLGDGFIAKIEGNQLTVEAARGPDGLIYQAD